MTSIQINFSSIYFIFSYKNKFFIYLSSQSVCLAVYQYRGHVAGFITVLITILIFGHTQPQVRKVDSSLLISRGYGCRSVVSHTRPHVHLY